MNDSPAPSLRFCSRPTTRRSATQTFCDEKFNEIRPRGREEPAVVLVLPITFDVRSSAQPFLSTSASVVTRQTFSYLSPLKQYYADIYTYLCICKYRCVCGELHRENWRNHKIISTKSVCVNVAIRDRRRITFFFKTRSHINARLFIVVLRLSISSF